LFSLHPTSTMTSLDHTASADSPSSVPVKMDPYYASDDEDDEAAAVAAAMGFSSFGGHKPPAKKRKFNSATDAFVEGQELLSLDKGGKKGQGSGGNTMPLGRQRVFGIGKKELEVVEEKKTNRDEIDLDDLDEDAEEDGPRYIDTSRPAPLDVEEYRGSRYIDASQPAPIEAGYGDGDGDGPQYIDTSQPPPAVLDQEAQEMQARIDAILASIQPADTDTDPAPTQDFPQAAMPDDTQAQPRPHGLPQRPPPAFIDTAFMQGNQRQAWSDTASVASSSRDGGRGRGRDGGRGQRNERWYEEYYDPSFNENPWERLEKAKGLKQLGKWPENLGRS
jgi:hypothetical protein